MDLGGLRVVCKSQGRVAPAPRQTRVPPATGGTKYTIKAGDNLYAIAISYGITLEQLLAANPEITNPGLIFVGQIINIPTSGAT